MRRKLILTTVVTVALTGCVHSQQWVPTKYAKVDLEQAQNECRFEAEKAAPMMDLNANVFAQGAAQGDIFRKCMQAKGFRLEKIDQPQKAAQ